MKKISIAVDGPSAAGKSSIAKIVAKRLDYIYIDTGAMYRCVGYYCLENNIDLKDEQAVSQALKQIKIEMDSNNHIFLNGQDVSQVIRQDQVSMSASVVSSYQAVRTFLVDLELIKKDIEQRDYQDMNRDISPLKQAEDAIVLDTSAMTLQEVVDAVLKLVEEKIKEV